MLAAPRAAVRIAVEGRRSLAVGRRRSHVAAEVRRSLVGEGTGLVEGLAAYCTRPAARKENGFGGEVDNRLAEGKGSALVAVLRSLEALHILGAVGGLDSIAAEVVVGPNLAAVEAAGPDRSNFDSSVPDCVVVAELFAEGCVDVESIGKLGAEVDRMSLI